MKEVNLCAKNGITDITEMKIGFDGIVVANAKDGPTMSITRKRLSISAEVPIGVMDGVRFKSLQNLE